MLDMLFSKDYAYAEDGSLIEMDKATKIQLKK